MVSAALQRLLMVLMVSLRAAVQAEQTGLGWPDPELQDRSALVRVVPDRTMRGRAGAAAARPAGRCAVGRRPDILSSEDRTKPPLVAAGCSRLARLGSVSGPSCDTSEATVTSRSRSAGSRSLVRQPEQTCGTVQAINIVDWEKETNTYILLTETADVGPVHHSEPC